MNDAWRFFISDLSPAAASPVFALGVIFTIIALIVYHAAIARPRAGGASGRSANAPPAAAAPDVSDLRNRIAALEAACAGALQSVGFVRFNAFPDVGSELSYALAVVDGRGDGFVVSSIYSREEVRTYAKSVKRFEADKDMSEEERRALAIAKERSGRPR